MKFVLYILQILNIAIAFSTIIIGLRSIKYLKENKILLFIPILSLTQIIVTELKGLFEKKDKKVPSLLPISKIRSSFSKEKSDIRRLTV